MESVKRSKQVLRKRRSAGSMRTSSARVQGYDRGRYEGYGAGYGEGRRLGFAETLAGSFPPDGLPVRNVSILYVTSGIGDPYPALDQAIIEALSGLAAQLHVASPSDPVPSLAQQYRPDLVLVLNGTPFPKEHSDQLRSMGVRTAVWFTDDPYYTEWTKEFALRYDDVFTLEQNCVPFYEKLGCSRVHYLPFAFSPSRFRPQPVQFTDRHDFCLIGTAFWNRVQFVDELSAYFQGHKTLISGWWWDRLQTYSVMSRSVRSTEWLSAEQTAYLYNGAKIVMNVHRSIDDATINHNTIKIPAASPNPRCFEINGCGSFQLVDARSGLGEIYEPGKEIETFRTPAEFKEKADYYLRHEEERLSIAMNGLNRSLKEHTYRMRIHQLLTYVFG